MFLVFLETASQERHLGPWVLIVVGDVEILKVANYFRFFFLFVVIEF